MAARQIQIVKGTLSQAAANSTEYITIPVVTRGERALQVYGVEFSMNGAFIEAQGSHASFMANLKAVSKSGAKVMPLHRWCKVLFLIGGGGGVGAWDLTDTWVAPPSLVVGLDHLIVELTSTNLDSATAIDYQVFYKPVGISDIQALQFQTE